MTFFATIKNGKLAIRELKEFRSYLKKSEGKKLLVNIKIWRKNRTDLQNNLYWKWLEIMANGLGYDVSELHSSLKAKFLTDESRKIPLVRSTTALNTKEFGLYLDKVHRLAGELGIELPSPEDYYQKAFYG